MEYVFGDTSGWANAFVATESNHSTATDLVQKWQQDGSRIVTTNYVLSELTALMTSPLRIPRPGQIQILDAIMGSSWIDVVHVDETLHQKAMDLFHNRPDKQWSLVDCASFALMMERKLLYAFTSDHHFDQAGFIRLLK